MVLCHIWVPMILVTTCGFVFVTIIVIMKVKELVIQSCLTLCDPMDCSPPGSSVHGIPQARILEWVAIPFSIRSFWPGIEPDSPTFQADSLRSEPSGTIIFNDWTIFHCTEVLPNPSSCCLLHNRPINQETSCWGKQYRLYLESQQTEKMVG